MANKKPRSPLQEWASERCYINKGRLASVAQSILQIAKDNSTLPNEYKKLMIAYGMITETLRTWDSDDWRNVSKEYYLKKAGLL